MVMRSSLLLLISSAVSAYTLIETYQLFALLRMQSHSLHLLEVGGVTEEESQLMPRIPTAKYISLKDLSDLSSWPLVKTPRQEDFVGRMKAYGVKFDKTPVVLYDRFGMLFAAKAWWVLTVFGRDYVTVLNGGLPKWVREGYAIQLPGPSLLLDPRTQDPRDYQYELDLKRMWTVRDLTIRSSNYLTEPIQLLDVRSKADFDASSLKGSINMPIEIVRRADGTLRSAIELNMIFQLYSVRVNNDTLTVVMGLNGVDSSMALLSLAVVGDDHSAMVDGGWMEYSQWLRKNGSHRRAVSLSAAVEGASLVQSVAFVALLAVTACIAAVCCGGNRRTCVQPPIAQKWL